MAIERIVELPLLLGLPDGHYSNHPRFQGWRL
jgi:hypothetical protein